MKSKFVRLLSIMLHQVSVWEFPPTLAKIRIVTTLARPRGLCARCRPQT